MSVPAGPGSAGCLNHALLESACAQAGVALGAFDHRILSWLSGHEPETAVTVAGWIARAHAAWDGPALVLVPGGREPWKLYAPGEATEPVCEGTLDQVMSAARLIERPLVIHDPSGPGWERSS